MVGWNKLPPYVEQVPPVEAKKPIRRLILIALACGVAAKYGPLFMEQNALAGYVFSGAAALAVLMAIQVFFAAGEHKPLWDSLNEAQRKLLGLGPAKRLAGAPAAARAPPAVEPLVTPPSRTARPFLQPVVTGEEVQTGGQLRTPGSRGSARNVTPEQLRKLQQELDEHVEAAAQAANGTPEYAPLFSAGPAVQPGISPMAGANTYRPSATPRGTAAAPIRSDGRVTQSLPTQRSAVMQELDTSEEKLEIAVEELREWFASEVLQPLEAAINRAHTDVIAGAAQLGIQGLRLTPLSDLGLENATRAADDSLMLTQIKARIAEYMRNPANQNSPQLMKCMQDVIKYQKLLMLLRGEYPSSNLLPPTPDGYILNRIGELANGSCMIDYKWDGGSPQWNGKRWTPELPTDSALLLYLFAAFLAAPHWVFTDEDSSRIESPNGILYLGKIPPRVSTEYFAIIPTRPPAGKGTGIIGLQLGTQHPHFSFLREGETLLTETGQAALFNTIAFFLNYCRQHGNAIGGRSLDYLNLNHLFAPRFSLRRFRRVLHKRW